MQSPGILGTNKRVLALIALAIARAGPGRVRRAGVGPEGKWGAYVQYGAGAPLEGDQKLKIREKDGRAPFLEGG